MDAILKEFTQYGMTGLICAVLIYDVFYLQRKLMQIIEQNTAAMTKMAELLSQCQNICQHRRKDD